MCLAFPGKVISIKKGETILDFFGKRERAKINKDLTTVKVGDYVMISNGFVIKKINKKEAEEILELLKSEIGK